MNSLFYCDFLIRSCIIISETKEKGKLIDDIVIVDEHAHIYPTQDKAKRIIKTFSNAYRLNPTHVGEGTIEDLRAKMERDHIDYTILANFAMPKIILENNLWTLYMGKQYKNIIPLIAIHPEMSSNKVELIKDYIRNGARGIKIHSAVLEFDVTDERLTEVYEYCNEIHFPIVYHSGVVSNVKYNEYADIDRLMPVIDKYKGIPTILTHMVEGSSDNVIALSKEYKHIYFDTSICISGLLCIDRCHDMKWQNDDYVIDIINKVGSDRILYGSDYPFGSPIDDAKRFLNMKLSKETKAKILGQNALKLFNINI